MGQSIRNSKYIHESIWYDWTGADAQRNRYVEAGYYTAIVEQRELLRVGQDGAPSEWLRWTVIADKYPITEAQTDFGFYECEGCGFDVTAGECTCPTQMDISEALA